jgi:septal ring factor EnvC (AmiA/AmiB activator)
MREMENQMPETLTSTEKLKTLHTCLVELEPDWNEFHDWRDSKAEQQAALDRALAAKRGELKALDEAIVARHHDLEHLQERIAGARDELATHTHDIDRLGKEVQRLATKVSTTKRLYGE